MKMKTGRAARGNFDRGSTLSHAPLVPKHFRSPNFSRSSTCVETTPTSDAGREHERGPTDNEAAGLSGW